MKETDKEEIHYWKKIFIEIATRAIRQSHFEYQVISFPQKNIEIQDLQKLNSGIGIELVPEETVRDHIVRELLQMGLWKKIVINGNERSYWTDREVRFEIENDNYVDLTVERYEYRDDILCEYEPALLELKRLNTMQVDLKGTPPYKEVKSTKYQLGQIRKDIKKLRSIRKGIRSGTVKNKKVKNNNAVLAILTWGVLSSSEKSEVFEEFKLPNNYSEVRYFPTEWSEKGESVTKWCVVILTEIDNDKFKE